MVSAKFVKASLHWFKSLVLQCLMVDGYLLFDIIKLFSNEQSN